MTRPPIFASRSASLIALTLVTAALTGGALADAQSRRAAPAPAPPHLLVVPHTSEGTAALAHSDARVIAGYEAFSLVEAAGADDERLRRAGADRRDDMRTVQTAAGTIDPETDRRSLAGKEALDRDEVLALVQFVGPPKDAWLARLRATGVRIVSYQPENSYVVHAAGDQVERVAALVGGFAAVRAVGVLTATDKLEAAASATGRYAVQTVSGPEGEAAREDASDAGVKAGREVRLASLHTQYLQLTAVEAAELARDPAVVAIEPYAEPELADERAAQIVAGNLNGFAPSAPGYLDWLVDPARVPDETSFDFAIDVTDEGLDGGVNPPAHSDFRERGSVSNATRVEYLRNYSSDSGVDAARDCGGHGTNVASIAAGYNSASGAPAVEDTAGFNHGMGVAPFARLGSSKIFTCAGSFVSTGWTPGALASNAYDGSARISNNSWGTRGPSAWGAYSTRAQQYDAVVRDASTALSGNQQMVEVFAAGNDGDDNPSPNAEPNEGYGTIMAEATAKNVITVGAAEGVRASGTDACGVPDAGADSARDVIGFSSRGPTDDGRLKPDLVAPGTHMSGARPRHIAYTGSGTCTPFFGAFYSLVSGSSQAAPQVAGAAALVRHWYERTRGAVPSPALTKALLLNTATDLAGGDNGKGAAIAAGPNTDQGWGRVNLGAAFDSTSREYRDQLASDTLTASGQSRLRTYRALDPGKPVKVTLVWTDAPGATTGAAWVNNLDLEVVAGGQRYLGNVFAGAFSRTGGSADTRNNVESVYLPAGLAARFAVTVKGLQVAGNGVPGDAGSDPTDQDYALVVSNAADEPAPVLVHSVTSVSDPPAGGDGDARLEPDEEFSLTEQVRNAGTVGASGITAGLSAGGGVSITQPVSGYPDLAPGATAPNTTPFEAELPNAAACGLDVPATLDIATAGPVSETHRISLSLPTGEPGPQLTHDAGGLPGAIPDDSAAGVSSSVFVAERGRIKDLDVRLPGTAASPAIEHSFLGDVVIDLIGPDGTAVRLAEHPGGPDNYGKDFVNVTFDDEASLRLGAPDDGVVAQRPPYNNTFRPQNDQLSRFDGKSRRGTWTLRVRDLFERDTGTLRAWGLTTSKAVCDFDATPPDTILSAVPAGSTHDTSATFGFSSPDGGTSFECSLDGAAYEPCGSPRSYSGLSTGAHTFRVRAIDGSDNEDPTPAVHSWAIEAPTDVTAPRVTVTAPAPGSSTEDATPAIAGVAGTAPGDDGVVTVRLWSGTLAAGLPAQTMIVPRDAVSGAWAAEPSTPLDPGAYTVRAEQGDSAIPENVGQSAPVVFTVGASRPRAPAPSFAVAQAQMRLSDALAGRYVVLAACASACEVSATLKVSARAAKQLGLTARSLAIGSGVEHLTTAGTAAVKVRLSARARAALRTRPGATATLGLRIVDGDQRLVLRRRIFLRRAGALGQAVRRGMGLWSICSRACPLRAGMSLSARQARRLGMTPRGRGRVTIASGRLSTGPSARLLRVRVKRGARAALLGAAAVSPRLEVVAGRSPAPQRRARRTLRLRR